MYKITMDYRICTIALDFGLWTMDFRLWSTKQMIRLAYQSGHYKKKKKEALLFRTTSTRMFKDSREMVSFSQLLL